MSDRLPDILYRGVKGSRSGGRETVVSALQFDGEAGDPVEAERVTWTTRAAALMRELAQAGDASEREGGHALPYASLRASIASQVPEALVLERDLGAPWSDQPRALMDVPSSGDLKERLGRALTLWVGSALRPWATRVGAPEQLVDAIDVLASNAFSWQRRSVVLGGALTSDSFVEARDAIIHTFARCLEGKVLFEGMGPVRRIVRGRSSSNQIDFITWPRRHGEALYSMVATITVETVPFSEKPIATVRASRRRWMQEVPTGRVLIGQSNVSLTLMAQNGAKVCLEVPAPVRSQQVQDPITPEFLGHLLGTGADIGSSMAEQVERGASSSHFFGIPYSPRFGSHPIGAGVSTRDQTDLFDVVQQIMGGLGFVAIPFEETTTTKQVPKRAEELHKALETEALLSDIAIAVGRNDLADDASIRAAWDSLDLGEYGPIISATAASKAREKLLEVRTANAQRVSRAFGEKKPSVVAIARSENERRLLESVLRTLFGTSIEVSTRPLPSDVHGSRATLPLSEAKNGQRFEARVAAWRPLAELLNQIDGGCHALVQATDWYDGRPDDPVNKPAGRYALAAEANANVQYLRPRASGHRGFANYLHRIQAATYDLIFGHAGLVSDVANVVADAFRDSTEEPTSLIGISVLTQARTRLAGKGGKLCIATRVDCENGRTTARVGWYDGEMKWSARWEPLFKALKRIASPSIKASLGSGLATERASFQAFVREILDDCVEVGDRPLVMIDSTGAASLWPWLKDGQISGEITLGSERLDASRRWPGARLVRVRLGNAARIAERKTTDYVAVATDTGAETGEILRRYCPTIVARTVKLSSSRTGAHYWATAGYFQMSLPRGLSVYRRLVSLVHVAKAFKDAPQPMEKLFAPIEIPIFDVSYRLPNPIEITVASTREGDDPDRIAHLVASLRYGYGHTASATSLPAPLSFESKARDYMTRFALDLSPEEDDEAAEVGQGPTVDDGTYADEGAPDDAGAGGGASDKQAWDGILASKPGVTVLNAPLWPRDAGAPIFKPSDRSETAVHMFHQAPKVNRERPNDDGDEEAPTWSELAGVIRLPDFVTEEWLSEFVQIPNAQLRAIHQSRSELATLTGFDGWPDLRPDQNDFVPILLNGLRYPRFAAAICQIAKRSMASNKAKQWSPFNPLWRQAITAAKSTVRSDASLSRPDTFWNFLDILLKGDAVRLAKAQVVLGAYEHPFDAAIIGTIKNDGRLGDVREFATDAAEHLFRSDYEWSGDIRRFPPKPTGEGEVQPAQVEFADPEGPSINTARQTQTEHVPMIGTNAVGHSAPALDMGTEIDMASDAPDGTTSIDDEAAWRSAMGSILRFADPDAGPDEGVLAKIEEQLEAARQALVRYDASKKKAVSAQALLERSQAILEHAKAVLVDAGVENEDFGSVPTGSFSATIDLEAAASIEETLASAEEIGSAAREKIDKAQRILRQMLMTRLDEASALRIQAIEAGRSVIASVIEVLQRLAPVPRPSGDRQFEASVDSAEPPASDEPPSLAADAPEADETFSTPLDDVGEISSKRDWDSSNELDEFTPVEDADLVLDRFATEPDEGEDALASGPDPMVAKLEERFEEFVVTQRFGLAFHLSEAARRAGLHQDFAVSLPELKLAAFAGRFNHSAHQGSSVVHDLMTEAALVFESLDDEQSTTTARRIMGLASLAPFAIFHGESDAKAALESLRQVGPGLGKAVHGLREALAAPLRSGISLSPSLLRLAREDAQDDEYTRILADKIKHALEEFGAKRYKFQLGNKLRGALTNRDGALGNLGARVERGGQSALDAARKFAAQYNDRSSVIHLLEETEKRVATYKLTGIDGIAREKLVGLIQSLAQLCAEYVDSADAAPVMKGMRANIQKARSGITDAVDTLDGALAQFPAATALEASAVKFAREAFDSFKKTLNGGESTPSPVDHLVALHGQLLWVSALNFGRGWYPAPYAPETVTSALVGLGSDQIHGAADGAAFDTAIRKRLAVGSHIAASMMIEMAVSFGVADFDPEGLSELRLADEETKRDSLEADLRDARLMVDRVQRMGGVGSIDEAQSLLSLLDRIEPRTLPEIVPLEARTEATEDDEQILDFRAAYGLVADVKSKVDVLLTRPREQLLARLGVLESRRTAAAGDLETVRGLVQRDDLLTATEYVEFLENGRGLPETTSPNPRYRAYFPKVPDALAEMSRTEQDRILSVIEGGGEFAGLNFGRIAADRRADVVNLLEEWNELKRAVASLRQEADVAGRLVRLLEGFGLNVVLRSPNPRGNRKFYTVDMHVDLLPDSASVLLPDFGSLTGGEYRFCIGPKMPTDGEVAGIEADAGALRLVFVVTDMVPSERRRQQHLSSLEKSRRLLAIDESIVYFTLSEPESRGLTLFELAQPFSFADPYRDYGNQAVPREMFFGRAEERRKLLEPHGSCIVYGGRRLGKTALLRHLQSEEDDPGAGTAVAYVNINDIGTNAGEEQIWESMSRELKPIFSKPVEQSDRFSETIRRWLAGDSKRRVLVLLDESDRFIQADATKDFVQFIRLQRLMDDTNRRFKFVLAGLHNVTRLVHTENPPLKHIASDPQRIGPLMDDELGDAEALVKRPLAGMGYEFENREDVWRILSYCNYYPVLVQKFCEGLVRELVKETLKKRRPITGITSDHVRLALENETIAKEIGETFDFTISKIEDRYSLIANIVAERALRDAADGRVGEGMTAVEVRDAAASWWPAAFGEANRLSVAEDLLDEMEGLGVLRRVQPDRWALRSPTILRLLGNDDKIAAKLGEFMDRNAPPVFDPRSMRRKLKANAAMRIQEGGMSPLTLGQEHDMLRDRVPATLIFGNALSDIGMVTGALSSASSSREDKRGTGHVTARSFQSMDAMLKDLKGPLPGEPAALLVVHDASPWNAAWVEGALRARSVREGKVRLIFVGQPEHALDWVRDPSSKALSKEVKIVPLQTWSTTLADHFLHQEHLDPMHFRASLQAATGGFNRLMQQLFTTGGTVNAKSLATRLENTAVRRRRDPALPGELGLAGAMYDIFKAVAVYTEGDITAYEIGEGPVAELGANLAGQQVVDFGVMMGLLEAQGAGSARDEDSRPYRLNALARSLLGAGGS